LNFLERFFRRRAMQRDDLTEDRLPPSLQAVPVGTVVAIAGYNFRVVHRRCGRRGANPGLVLAPIGPTRKRLKQRRNFLKELVRRARKRGAAA
jgi:hypothetical protein